MRYRNPALFRKQDQYKVVKPVKDGYVLSPITNKPIIINGPIYRKLVADGTIVLPDETIKMTKVWHHLPKDIMGMIFNSFPPTKRRIFCLLSKYWCDYFHRENIVIEWMCQLLVSLPVKVEIQRSPNLSYPDALEIILRLSIEDKWHRYQITEWDVDKTIEPHILSLWASYVYIANKVYRNKDKGFQNIIKGIGNELGRGLVCRPNGATNEEESQIYIRNKVYAIVHERRIHLRKTIEDEEATVERYRLQVIRKEAQLARCEKIHENAEKRLTQLEAEMARLYL